MRQFSIFLSLLINMSVLCSVPEKSQSFGFREKFGFDLLRKYSEEGFAVGTLVATSDGFKTIETIKKNDLVLDHHGAFKKVLRVAIKNVSHIICFVIDDQEIQAGRDQLFYLSHTQQWCEARDLKNHGIESSLKKEAVKLYQLTVEDHIFSIEKSNIIVHNIDGLVTPAGALFYFASATNPVVTAISATIALSALAYKVFKTQKKQKKGYINDVISEIDVSVESKKQEEESIVSVDQISEDIRSSQDALERRTKTLEKLKKVCKERASAASGNGPANEGPDDDDPDDKDDDALFRKLKKNYAQKARSLRHGLMFKDPATGHWWLKDTAHHGKSYYKVYKECATQFEWIFNSTLKGVRIYDQHKGPIGLIIPYKEVIFY